MASLFATLRKRLIRMKVYMNRAGSYISLINTGMILFLLLSNLERYGIDIDIHSWLIPIFIAGASMMIFFGYMEDKLGFYREEQKTTQSRSPYFGDMVKRLDRIEKQLESIKASKK